MKIIVVVKPNSSKNEVTLADDGSLVVRVTAPPAAGEANAKMIGLLSRHFGIPKSRISISRGATSRRKIVEID